MIEFLLSAIPFVLLAGFFTCIGLVIWSIEMSPISRYFREQDRLREARRKLNPQTDYWRERTAEVKAERLQIEARIAEMKRKR